MFRHVADVAYDIFFRDLFLQRALFHPIVDKKNELFDPDK